MGLGIMAVRPGDDDIHAGAFRDAGHRFQRVRFDEVVGIEEIQVFPSGVVHAVVAGDAGVLVGLREQRDASIPFGDGRHDFAGIVGRTVIDDDDLDVLRSLLDDARHALGDILLRVIRGMMTETRGGDDTASTPAPLLRKDRICGQYTPAAGQHFEGSPYIRYGLLETTYGRSIAMIDYAGEGRN